MDNPISSGAVSGAERADGGGRGQAQEPSRRRTSKRARRGRPWSRAGTGDRAIASVDSLISRAEEHARATGKSQDDAAAVVINDLEQAANALTTRTAPLVPATGVLVALSGLLVKAEPSSRPLVEVFVSLAIFFAVAGFAFLTRGLFLYAGRRVIGLSPTVEDIGFARERLVRKYTSSHRGSLLAGVGLTWLIIGILSGVHINIQ